MTATDPPTHRQLSYLKQLAYNRGISFIPPSTRLEASHLIDQLKRRAPSPRFELDADREQTSALHGEHAPASSPRDDEITGYGSHAHWRHTPPHRR
jgi:hypothetical protein